MFTPIAHGSITASTEPRNAPYYLFRKFRKPISTTIY